MFTSLKHLRGHVIELGLDLGEQILDLAKCKVFSECLQEAKRTDIHKSRKLVWAGNIFHSSRRSFCSGRAAGGTTGFLGLLRF